MNNKQSICIFTASMAAGGAEKVISLLLPELAKSYNVHLFTLYNSVHYHIPENVNRYFIFNDIKKGLTGKIISFTKGLKYFKKFLFKHKIDYVVSFLFVPNIINGIVASKKDLKKITFIASERNYPSIEYKSSKLRYIISKLFIEKFYNNVDLLFSNSLYINEDLKNNFGVNIPMTVIYNPVCIPKQYRNASYPFRYKLVSVGRFIDVKNHQLLFEVISKLETFKLTIIGDGPLREEYIKRINLLNIKQRVNLPGISNKVTEDLLENDIFILTSNSEGFPNSLLEAMSIGLPVISTNCLSGPLEMLNDNYDLKIEKGGFAKGKYGLMVNINDADGIVSAIKFLISSKEIYNHYSCLSRERALKYSTKNIYSDFIKLLRTPNK